ncbi:MAG: hypothetical protein ACRD0E_06010, partial [Acidimicrobiales bacterium]
MVGSRSGERSDLERLEELCTQARNEVIHLRGGPQLLGAIPSGVPDSNSLGDLLSDPSSKLLVGLIDDFVVGFATASSGDLPRSPRQVREPDHVLVGTIDHLYV